jgi:hypothetical protein
MRLNRWVWTKAVRRSGKSSGSREGSKMASGTTINQAGIIARCCTGSTETQYKLRRRCFSEARLIRTLSDISPRQMEHRKHVTG